MDWEDMLLLALLAILGAGYVILMYDLTEAMLNAH